MSILDKTKIGDSVQVNLELSKDRLTKDIIDAISISPVAKISDFRINKEENIFFIRKNDLLSELMKNQGTYFRIQKKSLENYRSNNKVDNDIKNLGYLITEKFINVCKSREIHISKNLNLFLSKKIP